jgi:hypothetical protein
MNSTRKIIYFIKCLGYLFGLAGGVLRKLVDADIANDRPARAELRDGHNRLSNEGAALRSPEAI